MSTDRSMIAIAVGAAAWMALILGILLGASLQASWSITNLAECAKQWQTLIAAVVTIAVTIVGLSLAWKSAKRQLRINIVAREEDRIERSLAGLKDAAALLAKINLVIPAMHSLAFASEILKDVIGQDSGQPTEEIVDAKIPNADSYVQQQVCEIIRELYFRFENVRMSSEYLAQKRKNYNEL